jgi:hypothetical protein
MLQAISARCMLIEVGTPMPASLVIDTQAYSSRWMSVKSEDSHLLEKGINQVGWTFFFLAGSIDKTAFSWDKAAMVRRAVKRLLYELLPQNFNCLQIDGLKYSTFLGIPFVKICAHARHIQHHGRLSSARAVTKVPPYRLYI